MIRATNPGLVRQPRRTRAKMMVWLALPILLLGIGASCSMSETIDRLTIVNRTPFDVDVRVSDTKKDSWLILGRAAHESSTVNELVTDMGETWVFQFSYGGRSVGELSVERDELRRSRWRVEVPSSVADRLRQLGFEPPPEG